MNSICSHDNHKDVVATRNRANLWYTMPYARQGMDFAASDADGTTGRPTSNSSIEGSPSLSEWSTASSTTGSFLPFFFLSLAFGLPFSAGSHAVARYVDCLYARHLDTTSRRLRYHGSSQARIVLPRRILTLASSSDSSSVVLSSSKAGVSVLAIDARRYDARLSSNCSA